MSRPTHLLKGDPKEPKELKRFSNKELDKLQMTLAELALSVTFYDYGDSVNSETLGVFTKAVDHLEAMQHKGNLLFNRRNVTV